MTQHQWSKGELVERVMAESGMTEPAAADRLLRITLATLGERLTEGETAALAREMPPAFASVLLESTYDRDFDADEFYERVHRREGVSPGFAREHAQVALRVLGAALGDEQRVRLGRILPPGIVESMQPRAMGAPLPHVARSHAPPLTTLATAHPGSRHPLSEAAAHTAHTHSIAREDNPHGATKLSGARGLTQEREEESLASGRGGPERPLSEAGDETTGPR